MASRPGFLILGFLLLALALPACAQQQAPTLTDLEGSHWRLVNLNGEAPPPPLEITLAFRKEGEFSGSGGCNTFIGRAALPTGKPLEIGPLATTKMSCGELADGWENRFLETLSASRALALEEGALLFLGENQTPLLRFEPQEGGPGKPLPSRLKCLSCG